MENKYNRTLKRSFHESSSFSLYADEKQVFIHIIVLFLPKLWNWLIILCNYLADYWPIMQKFKACSASCNWAPRFLDCKCWWWLFSQFFVAFFIEILPFPLPENVQIGIANAKYTKWKCVLFTKNLIYRKKCFRSHKEVFLVIHLRNISQNCNGSFLLHITSFISVAKIGTNMEADLLEEFPHIDN